MSGDKWIPTRCGDGKLSGDAGAAEYPCVRRYRHRRLLTFLWLQGFKATHESMLGESDGLMCVRQLQQMVLQDQWGDANQYLCRFLRPGVTSVEAMVLNRFFNAFSTIASVVIGKKEDELSKQYLDHKRTICQGQIRLRSIRLNAQQARASIDWERVKKKAAEVLEELAFATPELKDLIFMPRGPMKPHNVLPIGFGFRRRCRPKKQSRKPKSPAGVAKSYLGRWRRIPASSDHSQETLNQKLIKALDRLADILDECLKAGKLEVHPLQTTEMKGTTDEKRKHGCTVDKSGRHWKMQKNDNAAVNLGRTQGGDHLLIEINNSIDDVSSCVDDLCLISSPSIKEIVKCHILSRLEEIKNSIALLVAQTAASTFVRIDVPLAGAFQEEDVEHH